MSQSERDTEIKALKAVFVQANNTSRREDHRFSDRDLYWDVAGALIDIGKKQFYELKNEVRFYLNDPYAEFRAEAVRTLGWNTRLGDHDFQKNEAYKIWLEDPDEEVKVAALSSWGTYYVATKDVWVLKILYNILKTKNKYSNRIKAHALDSFLDVADAMSSPSEGYEILALSELETSEEFNNAVNWPRLHEIMKIYVPGWKEVS